MDQGARAGGGQRAPRVARRQPRARESFFAALAGARARARRLLRRDRQDRAGGTAAARAVSGRAARHLWRRIVARRGAYAARAQPAGVCDARLNGYRYQNMNLPATSPQQPATSEIHIAIRSTRPQLSAELRELWEHRELFYFLAWRDIKVRYKQTVLGVAWALMQPLLTMLAFTLFFGYLGNMPSNGIPYAIFAFTALLPWQLFAYSLSAAGNSLI